MQVALGAVYALLDTYYSFRGRVFLGRYPLGVSLMEALFIGLLDPLTPHDLASILAYLESLKGK